MVGNLDSFPYVHQVGALMASPAVTIARDVTVRAAAALMQDRHINSLLIVDGMRRPEGIFTERDLAIVVATQGTAGMDCQIERLMSRPVHSVSRDAFVYVAIARMDRLGLRHLAVVEPGDGQLVGVISARTLLRLRARHALLLGDDVACAEGRCGI